MRGNTTRMLFLVGAIVLVPFVLVGVSVYRQDAVRRGIPSPDATPAPFIEQAPAPPLAGGRIEYPPEVVRRQVVQAFPQLVIDRGSRRIPVVALTFDDGPDQYYTPRVLDILSQKGAKGTFYFTGHHAEAYPAVAQRTLREGHEVGNHSYNHPHLKHLNRDDIRNQLLRTHDTIRAVTGRDPQTFRPPYGEVTLDIASVSKTLGYRIILWDIDTLDWEGLNKQQVLDRTLPNIRPGSIILFHSASGGPQEDLTGMLRALPVIIDHMNAQGLKSVTVSEMLNMMGLSPTVAAAPY